MGTPVFMTPLPFVQVLFLHFRDNISRPHALHGETGCLTIHAVARSLFQWVAMRNSHLSFIRSVHRPHCYIHCPAQVD